MPGGNCETAINNTFHTQIEIYDSHIKCKTDINTALKNYKVAIFNKDKLVREGNTDITTINQMSIEIENLRMTWNYARSVLPFNPTLPDIKCCQDLILSGTYSNVEKISYNDITQKCS